MSLSPDARDILAWARVKQLKREALAVADLVRRVQQQHPGSGVLLLKISGRDRFQVWNLSPPLPRDHDPR
jgi:hypothetical protein